MQFLEYFHSLVLAKPNCQVRIVSYLIENPKKGSVIYDLLSTLNKRPSRILVGTSRYIPQRSLEREIKGITKLFPKIKIDVVYNDHRKLFYLEDPIYNGSVHKGFARRAWVGSQNLCESFSKNLVIEVPPEEIDAVRLEIADLK